VSLPHQNFVFCQETSSTSVFFTRLHLVRCLSSMVTLIAVTTLLLTYVRSTSLLDLLDLLPWRRRCAHRQLHEAAPCRTMLSHLCCLMNVDVTLFTVVLHHVNQSLLGSSLSSCPTHISVKCQFRISRMIHYLHDKNTEFAVAVCDLLRPRVDQPYHTPLYS